MSRRGAIAGAAAVALVAVLLAPSLHDGWQERRAIRAFQAGLLAIELARQEQLLKGISPLDKGRTPAHERALQRWEFAETHRLVRQHRPGAPPEFGKYLALLDGVYARTLDFDARVQRLDALRRALAELRLEDAARPERNALALREAAEARHISAGLRAELDSHHEHARRAIAVSGLDDRSRAMVWRVADEAFVGQLAVVAAAERWAPELGRLERALRFFADNRQGYEVLPGHGLVFRSAATELRYQALMRQLSREARAE